MQYGYAQEASLSPSELKKLTVEELMEIEVTSVSRRSEKLVETASAIQVITGEDIHRSGATSIPEALRLATNLHVAQKNAHDWAISARGFNTDLANKMLVLIDGRTVYTPLFSGVFWDRQDYLLEDIERIEVISGPGSTLWGANAVNGVINIITKKANATRGLYAEAGGGNELRAFGGLRYGARLGEKTSFRVYGKYFDRDDAALSNGEDASDSWNVGQGGFRMDAAPSEKNAFTLQSDYYHGDQDIATGGAGKAVGGNVLGRWTRTISGSSDLSLQLYYDRTHLEIPVPETVTDAGFVAAPAGTFKDNLNTYDIDFQHRVDYNQRNKMVWGLGYRFTRNEVENAPALAFLPAELDRSLVSAFVQHEMKLSDDFLFMLGTKVEHNDYTKFEFEPSLRLHLNVGETQNLWAAVSRAVRMPSRVDRHIRLPTPAFAPFFENLLIGGEAFDSETVIAYELGYRVQFGSMVSASVSSFYNVYDKIRSTSAGPPPFGLPLFYDNNLEGETYGAEVTLAWQPQDWWRLRIGYSYLAEDIRVKPGKTDFNNALNENADPPNRFSLQSFMNLSPNITFDTRFRVIDSFEYNTSGVASTMPSYAELEARLAWLPTNKLELSITGQHLLHDQHLEYVISSPNPRAEIQRSVYLKGAYRF